jgi:hypothetical protein
MQPTITITDSVTYRDTVRDLFMSRLLKAGVLIPMTGRVLEQGDARDLYFWTR